MNLLKELKDVVKKDFDNINSSAKPELCSRVRFWSNENIILITPFLLENKIPYTVVPLPSSTIEGMFMLTIYDKNKN